MTEILHNLGTQSVGATTTMAFIGASEIVIVLVIALVVFGPQRLPEIGRQIGSLKRQMDRMKDDLHRTIDNLDDYTSIDTPATQRYEPPYGPTYPQIESDQPNYAARYDSFDGEDTTPSRTALLDNAYFKEPPGPVALSVQNTSGDIEPVASGNIGEAGASEVYNVPTNISSQAAKPVTKQI